MKHSLLTLFLAAVVLQLSAQLNLDSIWDQQYYISTRVAVSIKRLPENKMYPLGKINFWTFIDAEFKSPYGYGVYGGQHYYKIVNQAGDTAWLPYDVLKERIYDEYALITPQKFKQLQLKYGSQFPSTLKGRVSIGMTKEQVKIALGNPSDIHTLETKNLFNEQWIYRGYSSTDFYYFRNNKVNAIQSL